MENYFPTSIDQYLEIFYKRKKLFFIPFFFILASIAALYPFLPRSYRSTTVIAVDDDAMLQSLASDDGYRGRRNEAGQKIQTLWLALLTPSNVRDILTNAGVLNGKENGERAQELISSAMGKIEYQPVDNLIDISFEDADNHVAQNVTNAVAEKFLALSTQEKVQNASQAIQFIERQLHLYRDRLQDSEKIYVAGEIENQLSEAQRRRTILADQAAQARRSIPASGGTQESPDVAKLRQELVSAQSSLKQLLLDAKQNNPMVQDLREKISDLETRIQLMKDSAGEINDASPSSNPAYQDASIKLKEADLEIDSLRRKLVGVKDGTLQLKDMASQASNLDGDKQVTADMYKTLLTHLESAQMTQQLGNQGSGTPFRILSRAGLAQTPVSPDPVHTAGFGFLSALMGGLAIVFAREYFDSSFRGVNDAKRYLKIPMLAFIPRITVGTNGSSPIVIATRGSNGERRESFGPARPRAYQKANLTYTVRFVRDPDLSPQIVTFHDPESPPAEYYRMLRTHLLTMRERTPFKTLLFTSSLEGEGKSTTSLNLAMSVAHELKERVVLIDCDLRKGSLARNVSLPQEKGLSEFLSGSCDVEAVIKKTKVDGLSIITAGKFMSNPARLLTSTHAGRLMQALRSRYDLILMDAPPVLHLSDVPLLAAHADAVVFVVQSGRTRRELVTNAYNVLEQNNKVPVLGYVLTQVDQNLPSYMQHYLYGGTYA